MSRSHKLKLRSLTKVSSINAVFNNGTNHCDYKDMQKSHNKVKIIEKVLFTAHLVFCGYNYQKLVVTLCNFPLRSLSYGFPCIHKSSDSTLRALSTMP